jgi:hypothetical protein
MRRISHLISDAQDSTNYWDHLGGMIAIVPWPQLTRPALGQLGGGILLGDLGGDLIAAHCRVTGFRWIDHRPACSQQRQTPRTHQEIAQYPKGWRHRFLPSNSLAQPGCPLHWLDHMPPVPSALTIADYGSSGWPGVMNRLTLERCRTERLAALNLGR